MIAKSLDEDIAIVLKSFAYGDSDRIVHYLTESNGKVALIVKGCASLGSKLRPYCEPFSVIEINFITPHTADALGILVGGRVILNNRTVRKSLEGMTTIGCVIKLFFERIDSSHGDYSVISRYLETQSQDGGIELIYAHSVMVMMYLLEEEGYGLQLDNDLEGNPLNENYSYIFDTDELGWIQNPMGWLDSSCIKLLRICNTSESIFLRISDINSLSKPIFYELLDLYNKLKSNG